MNHRYFIATLQKGIIQINKCVRVPRRFDVDPVSFLGRSQLPVEEEEEEVIVVEEEVCHVLTRRRPVGSTRHTHYSHTHTQQHPDGNPNPTTGGWHNNGVSRHGGGPVMYATPIPDK